MHCLGIELDGEAVLADRLVALALVIKGIAEVEVRERVFRIELDGEVVLADRLVEPVLTAAKVTQIITSKWGVRKF